MTLLLVSIYPLTSSQFCIFNRSWEQESEIHTFFLPLRFFEMFSKKDKKISPFQTHFIHLATYLCIISTARNLQAVSATLQVVRFIKSIQSILHWFKLDLLLKWNVSIQLQKKHVTYHAVFTPWLSGGLVKDLWHRVKDGGGLTMVEEMGGGIFLSCSPLYQLSAYGQEEDGVIGWEMAISLIGEVLNVVQKQPGASPFLLLTLLWGGRIRVGDHGCCGWRKGDSFW